MINYQGVPGRAHEDYFPVAQTYIQTVFTVWSSIKTTHIITIIDYIGVYIGVIFKHSIHSLSASCCICTLANVYIVILVKLFCHG
jgi:hypothetical protein